MLAIFKQTSGRGVPLIQALDPQKVQVHEVPGAPDEILTFRAIGRRNSGLWNA